MYALEQASYPILCLAPAPLNDSGTLWCVSPAPLSHLLCKRFSWACHVCGILSWGRDPPCTWLPFKSLHLPISTEFQVSPMKITIMHDDILCLEASALGMRSWAHPLATHPGVYVYNFYLQEWLFCNGLYFIKLCITLKYSRN